MQQSSKHTIERYGDYYYYYYDPCCTRSCVEA